MTAHIIVKVGEMILENCGSCMDMCTFESKIWLMTLQIIQDIQINGNMI
jgi:hypothetical protein